MIREAGQPWREPLHAVGTRNWRPRFAAALARMQDEAMRQNFPDLKLLLDLPWLSIWEGDLRPLSANYRVRIVDYRGADDGRLVFTARWPSVRVLTPLFRRVEAPEDPVPHIYGDHDDPRGADLCLFHPASREWTDDMLLADSIVPWAAEWLFYFEMWQVTGSWGGAEAPHSTLPSPNLDRSMQTPGRRRRLAISGSLLRSMSYACDQRFRISQTTASSPPLAA